MLTCVKFIINVCKGENILKTGDNQLLFRNLFQNKMAMKMYGDEVKEQIV